jgi:hypothetical protein
MDANFVYTSSHSVKAKYDKQNTSCMAYSIARFTSTSVPRRVTRSPTVEDGRSK